jgi:hypothetical protein
MLLSGAGAGVLDAWVAGVPVADRPAEGRLARQLVDAGTITNNKKAKKIKIS